MSSVTEMAAMGWAIRGHRVLESGAALASAGVAYLILTPACPPALVGPASLIAELAGLTVSTALLERHTPLSRVEIARFLDQIQDRQIDSELVVEQYQSLLNGPLAYVGAVVIFCLLVALSSSFGLFADDTSPAFVCAGMASLLASICFVTIAGPLRVVRR